MCAASCSYEEPNDLGGLRELVELFVSLSEHVPDPQEFIGLMASFLPRSLATAVNSSEDVTLLCLRFERLAKTRDWLMENPNPTFRQCNSVDPEELRELVLGALSHRMFVIAKLLCDRPARSGGEITCKATVLGEYLDMRDDDIIIQLARSVCNDLTASGERF